MSIGLLLLVATNKKNQYISHNPNITFFKKLISKPVNFSIESLPQYFKTIPDFGKQVTLNLSKSGDLVKNITLIIDLPNIPLSNHSSLPDNIKEFKWVNKTVFNLIKYIDLEIDNITIDRQYGDWLNIWYELTDNSFDKINNIIGRDIKLINEFSNGKENYKLYLPLKFFFNLDTPLCLPLIALTFQDVKLHIEFNSFDLCYKQSPDHYFLVNTPVCLFKKGERITQNYNGKLCIGEFVYHDINTNRIYYNKLLGEFEIPETKEKSNSLYNITGESSKFSLLPQYGTGIIKDENYLNIVPSVNDAYLIVEYIYIDEILRSYFINNKNLYVVPLVQTISEKVITSSNDIYKIPLTNLHKLLLWRCQLLSNIEINDPFNYTMNPLNYSKNNNNEYNFENSQNIIEKVKIFINSIQREQNEKFNFYSYLENYKYKLNSAQNGIYMYSFALNPIDKDPSGTFNFSKINDSYLQLTLNKLVNYTYPINIKLYGLHYNIFEVYQGNGGLKFFI